MTKRSTIGTNPLDEVIQNPLEATISEQSEGTEQSIHQEKKKQGNMVSSASEYPVPTPVLQNKEGATQNPPASQQGSPKGKPKIHKEDVAQPGQTALEILPHPDQMAERLSKLEEENLCLKWAVGLILAPLVLLALLG